MSFFDDDCELAPEQVVVNDAAEAIKWDYAQNLNKARTYVNQKEGLTPFLEKVKEKKDKAKKEWHDVLYDNRGLLRDFFDFKASEYADNAEKSRNQKEVSDNSRLASLSVLYRDCAENLEKSSIFKNETMPYLAYGIFQLNQPNPPRSSIIPQRCAKSFSTCLGMDEYMTLIERFYSDYVLSRFTREDLQTKEGYQRGLSEKPNLDSLMERKRVIDCKEAESLIELLADEKFLLPYYYQAMSEVACTQPDKQKMACLLMGSICKHIPQLDDDDRMVIVNSIQWFGLNDIDNLGGFYYHNANEIVQHLSFDYVENVLKEEVFAQNCPNKDCSETLTEAYVRTFCSI